jgi:hypothetical protein
METIGTLGLALSDSCFGSTENGRVGGHFRMGRQQGRQVFPCLLMFVASCGPGPGHLQPGADSRRFTDMATMLVQVHNRERAALGVAPLSWDPVLAGHAAAYARQLAPLGDLRHSPRTARPGQGENLWIGSRGAFSVQEMIDSWVTEKAYFRPGIFPAVGRTGHWSAVGHYTQMIWPTTRGVGCATASSARFDVLVCRYAPAGNIDGRRVP